MAIPVPRSGRRAFKAASSIGELNRWATDADRLVGDMLTTLQALARQVDLLGNQATPTTGGLVNHAPSHLPSGGDPLATAAAGTIEPNDVQAPGTANTFARSDHTHAIVAAAAVALASANDEGAATSFARSDHVHVYPDRLQDADGDQFVFSHATGITTLTLPTITALLADNASLQATTLQTPRGTVAIMGKTGVYSGVGYVGATSDTGTGPSAYLDSNGGITMIGHGASAEHTWTPAGSVLLDGSLSTAAIAPLTVRGSATANAIEIQNSSATPMTKWDHSGTHLLTSTVAHLETNVDQGTAHQVYWKYNPTGIVNTSYFRLAYEDQSNPSDGIFLGITNASTAKLFVGRVGGNSSSYIDYQGFGLGMSGKNATGTPALLLGTSGSSGAFSSSNRAISFVVSGLSEAATDQETLGGAIHFDCCRNNSASDNFVSFQKWGPDSTTSNDTFQFIHKFATVGGTRDIISMRVGTQKRWAVNPLGQIETLDTNASADERVILQFSSTTALSADRTLTFDMDNADRTLNFSWFDQDVSTTASPTFAGATIGGLDVVSMLLLSL